jgi:CheY-like chemotaxis protein
MNGPILLAEDNSDDAFLTTRALTTAGISQRIHHCSDGQAVVDYLEGLLVDREKKQEAELPELILLDLKMPRMGGLETLKWIRLHGLFNSVIVLALTSSSEQTDVKAAYDNHVNAYLVKPTSLSEMVELARSIRQFWLDQKLLLRTQLSFSSLGGVARS